MSKYFELNSKIEFRYLEDMKRIIAYLETMGTIRCTKKKIESLWEEFSTERGLMKCWLEPTDVTLYDFACWLDDYQGDEA